MQSVAAVMMLLAAFPGSEVAEDEVVACYPTFAARDPGGRTWTLHIHGLICEPQDSSVRRRAALSTLRSIVGVEETGAERERFERRIRHFLCDNERNKSFAVRLGTRRYLVGPSQANGHFDNRLRLSAQEVASFERDDRGWIAYSVALPEGDARQFRGRVQLVEPEGLSIVSDIDDTIKVSDVRDRRELLANTFLREFRAVEGMAPLYEQLAAKGAVFHYVSASPWQLSGPLAEFLDDAGFPAGSLHLKIVRAKDSTIFDLFGPQDGWKRGAIEPVLDAFPNRRFVLIGDTGEEDPEIFGDLARRYPGRIAGVFIRKTKGAANDDERLRRAFRDLDESTWAAFDDPQEIEPALLRVANAGR
ncbi:MAG: phosphatase domain-containing protein [Planctomycetales bacterium]